MAHSAKRTYKALTSEMRLAVAANNFHVYGMSYAELEQRFGLLAAISISKQLGGCERKTKPSMDEAPKGADSRYLVGGVCRA